MAEETLSGWKGFLLNEMGWTVEAEESRNVTKGQTKLSSFQRNVTVGLSLLSHSARLDGFCSERDR